MKMKGNQPLAKANPPAFTSVMKSCCTLSSSTTEIDKPGGGRSRRKSEGFAKIFSKSYFENTEIKKQNRNYSMSDKICA